MAKPLVDYKFWYIRRDDDVHISECAVRFYEGEHDEEGEYIRTKKLSGKELPDRKKKLDAAGKETALYTVEDFGVISTDEELASYMNKELKKFAGKTPVNEQK